MFYAIRRGRKNGIFTTWEECKRYTTGYSHAEYQKFSTIEEAEKYISDTTKIFNGNQKLQYPLAFIDGSYNEATHIYGYGGFIQVFPSERIMLQGYGNDEKFCSMRNVAGEITGCIAAVSKAEEIGLEKLTIYYDYTGIEQWAKGTWKRTKEDKSKKPYWNSWKRSC